MPEMLSTPPSTIESPFELAALRITTDWLRTRTVSATADDLRLATEYLRTVGMTVEPLPGTQREVRVVSERGRETIVSREAALLTAIRCLAMRESQRTTNFIERAA